MRVSPETSSALPLLARICAMTPGFPMLRYMRCTSPAANACGASDAPLYGMWVNRAPVKDFRRSIIRCAFDPMPEEA